MNNKVLDIAINEARLAERGKDQYRLIAIITDKRGKVLSIGQNSYCKTHTRQAYYAKKVHFGCKIYLHAEIDAIIKCNGKPHAIYVARVNRKGEPVLAAPCPICQSAIIDSNIKHIFHT